MNIDAIIRAVQKELGIGVDGRAGPDTWGAIYRKIVPGGAGAAGNASGGGSAGGTGRLPAAFREKADPRSEGVIATLHPSVQPYARALVLKAAGDGITIKVISGLRTYAEQDALYAKGRTRPGSRVTNARGGFSNHNFGIAFDVGVFNGSQYVPESPRYKAVGVLGMELGLDWGGNWKTIKDEPHFQMRPSWATDGSEREMLAGLRARKESGKDFYA